MKVLIDIPEEIYKEAIKSGYSYLYDEDVANAVANGTPLTKNYGNLKDVDAILDKLLEVGWLDGEAGDELESIFNLFPAIIEADKENEV